jgi:hypothetical protein
MKIAKLFRWKVVKIAKSCSHIIDPILTYIEKGAFLCIPRCKITVDFYFRIPVATARLLTF